MLVSVIRLENNGGTNLAFLMCALLIPSEVEGKMLWRWPALLDPQGQLIRMERSFICI